MQLSSLAGDQMRNLDADNCRDPLSELCVSLSWNENLVAHRREALARAASPSAANEKSSNIYVGCRCAGQRGGQLDYSNVPARLAA